MITKVTEQGVWIPKKWLDDVKEVEIRKEKDVILIFPIHVEPDPILQLGTQPVVTDVEDASIRHDHYLYSLAQ